MRLAIGDSGSGQPLLKVANWMTHVDRDAASPIWGHWVRDLSRKHRFIRYDARGCGLSDRDLAGISLKDIDLWVDDLARVADLLELDRVALLGLSQGGPVAIAFASRYPDRVSRLILHGSVRAGDESPRRSCTGCRKASLQVCDRQVRVGERRRTLSRDIYETVHSRRRARRSKAGSVSCKERAAMPRQLLNWEAAMHDAGRSRAGR